MPTGAGWRIGECGSREHHRSRKENCPDHGDLLEATLFRSNTGFRSSVHGGKFVPLTPVLDGQADSTSLEQRGNRQAAMSLRGTIER